MATTKHRHTFITGTRYGLNPSGNFRVCSECRTVQRKAAGRWLRGSQAANPTERKNIARRVLDDFEARMVLDDLS